MTISEPFSFTPPPPPVNHNFVIGELYLLVNDCVSYIGTVVNISERSLSIQRVIDGYNVGKHVIPLDFIDFSFRLSSLIPGNKYRFHTHEKKVFDANLIDILQNRSVRVDNHDECNNSTCVYTYVLSSIAKITQIE